MDLACQLMVYLLSPGWGQALCWAPDLGWHKALIATAGEKEMEAQRGEVTWPTSLSEKVSGLRSFLLPSHHHQASEASGFETDPQEQRVNDLNKELHTSFKKISSALFTSCFK